MFFELVILVFTYYLIRLLQARYLKTGHRSPLPPGPTGIPIFGYLPFLGSAPCKTVSNLSNKWGPIFTLKLGQYPVVFINDFEKIKELYKLDATTGRVHLALFEKRGIFGLGLLEGDGWKEVRRFLLKCLRDMGFGKRSMEVSIQDEVSQTIRFMKKKLDQPVYLKPLIELAVINALWNLMTGEKYDIEDPKKRKVAEIMSEGLSDQNIVGIVSFLPWLARLMPEYSGYKKALKYFDAPDDLAREIIEKHIKTYSAGNEIDFIDHALTKIYTTSDPSSMFYKDVGMKNLHYTLIDLFFASSDTMSSTLGWALLYLSLWPDKQCKLQEEIDKVISRTRLPCIDDRLNMPYMEATMHEVLRNSTMVPFGLLHKSLEHIDFESYSFPKGTYFLANLYHVFKDQNYWKDPESFRPERFLTESGEFRKDERLIPFFTGKRTCIAENLAMSEFFLFLSGLLQNFDFELCPNDPKPDLRPRSGFILPPPKHRLIVKERSVS